ncbi:DUF5946 family protein [Catenulispora subtropica]|uniref:Uncharacterized protein n=1 Tax=Catenulispora subtropica TaxID=450798 RepID=A0ABP5EFR0_9ACTN
MEPCAECGAASGSCDALFHGLLALDHSRQEPWGPLHGVSVSCYFLQHPSRATAGHRGREWELVRAYLDGGLAAVDWVVRRARSENSHRSPGLSVPEPPRVRQEPPARFAVTIEDVAVDGTFPADGFADRVTAWAAATAEAWRPDA